MSITLHCPDQVFSVAQCKEELETVEIRMSYHDLLKAVKVAKLRRCLNVLAEHCNLILDIEEYASK